MGIDVGEHFPSLNVFKSHIKERIILKNIIKIIPKLKRNRKSPPGCSLLELDNRKSETYFIAIFTLKLHNKWMWILIIK